MAAPRPSPTPAAVDDSYMELALAQHPDLSAADWRTLAFNLYPGANPRSVLMVLDYCAARKLDPLKKPCHIVQMNVKDARTGTYEWRDVVLPGIYEYRTTAIRTGLYLGHSEPEYGPEIKVGTVSAPEWCAMTFRRAVSLDHLSVVITFPVRVYFREVVGFKRGDTQPNERWTKAPIQMLTKCCEAAGLREAFPDEFGGEPTLEEMDGQNPTGELEAPRQTPTLRSATRKSAKAALAPVVDSEAVEVGGTVAAPVVAEPLPVAATEATEPAHAAPADFTIAQARACVPVGTIEAHDVMKEPGVCTAVVAVVSSGFRAVAKGDIERMQAVREAARSGRIVKLVTAPPKGDPNVYLPSIVAIEDVETEATP